jgi:hypothetical protein
MYTPLPWSLQPSLILGYWLHGISNKRCKLFQPDSMYCCSIAGFISLVFEVWPAADTILDSKKCAVLPS